MTSYVGIELRRFVESRASYFCEYCLIHSQDTYLGCQVDHIIAEKHGGATEADNLALACTFCNRSKGTDVGSVAASTGEFIRFFNPRIDRWGDHFLLQGALIVARTSVGDVTTRILSFNESERVIERESMQMIGRYPPSDALLLL